MALKPFNCPNCNGRIETFDETTNKGFCPYCDSIIMNVPELQQQFALDEKRRMRVAGIEAADEQYNRIATFVKLGRNADALQLATEYADKHPEESRAWRALCDLQLDSAISLDASGAERAQVKSYVSYLTILASSDEDKEYLTEVAKRLDKAKKEREDTVRELSKKRNTANDAAEHSKIQMDQAQNEYILASNASKKASDFATKGPGRIAAAVGVLWFFLFSSRSADFWLGGAILAAIAAAVIVNGFASARKKEASKTAAIASERLKELEAAHQNVSSNLNSVERELKTENDSLTYINEILSTIENR